jgi:hypothetical protein
MRAEERALMDNASHKWFAQALDKQRAAAAGDVSKRRRKPRKKR